MIHHVMLDLETWGTAPYSTIIMIGACVFDPYAEGIAKIITDRFEVSIDPESCQGMRIDPATMLWWMDHEREPARAIWLNKPKVSLPEALDGFSDWLGSNPDELGIDVRVWGNGSDFDNALLRQAYEFTKREAPWSFRHNRCFRTLKSMATVKDEQDFGVAPAHTALADAENQAIRTSQIVRKLGIKLT